MNPNNITSQYYDLVSSPLKSKDVTDEEISLINKILEPGFCILDVGAGTGRHAIELSRLGFKVYAIDSSTQMLKVLKENDTTQNVEIIDKNIYNYIPNRKFDLIILFWNSFNEIALTKKNALTLLSTLKSFLTTNGKILININDSQTVDPENFDFTTTKTVGEFTYKMHWSTFKYLKSTNTAKSKEDIEIYKNDKLIDKKVTFIKQRYWSLPELKEMSYKSGLKSDLIKLKTSSEIYLLLSILSK